MLRVAARGVGVGLALFHLWLLAGQAWDGRLFEPELLVRWLVAGILAACLIGVLRSGAPLFSSRKAVAVWLLAATLHGPVVVDRVGGTQGLPEVSTILAEIAGASALLGAAVMLLSAVSRYRASVRRHSGPEPLGYGSTLPPGLGPAPAFAPRPPPAR